MTFKKLKKILSKLRHTPMHPQWFVYKNEEQNRRNIAKHLKGNVLDIGCADQYMKNYINNNQNYIGLDYYQTATSWYGTKPDIFGDAQALPMKDSSVDSILLLDVLEHLPNPEQCISEICRVLKPKGIFILQVPFMYPIHDAPLDFHRWTQYALENLVIKNGFTIRHKQSSGKPLETAGLLLNIALVKVMLNWFATKNPLALLGILAPLIILSINLLCWVFSFISPKDKMMPYGYCLILEKNND